MSASSPHGAAVARFDPSGPYEVSFSDVVYAHAGGAGLLARVHRPVARGPWPALVDVHGGAWTYLDRTVDDPIAAGLAACGMVVVALDIRQGGAHRFPASVRDVLSGVRFVRREAAALDALPDPIGVVGGSSGGHLALLAALCPETPAFQEDDAQAHGDASVAYAMALWPVTDPLARYRYLEPLLAGFPPSPHDPFFDPARLRAAQEAHFGDEVAMHRASIPRILRAGEFQRLPPLWLAHAEHDRNVTLAMSEDVIAAYRGAGGQAELELFAGVGHAFMNFGGPRADEGIARLRAVCRALLERAARA